MPLQNHFRPPLSVQRHWHAFHNAWATYLSSDLNRKLPANYFAEANVQFGIEIDVAAFEEASGLGRGGPRENGEETGREESGAWVVPAPTQTIPLTVLTDVVEILVFNREAGPTLAGAIELISPANKDRPAHRDAFVSKCAAYLQQGVGLVMVDVVTDRRANLHGELLSRLQASPGVPLEGDLYAAAYRPVQRGDQPNLDIWQEPLTLGGVLPAMPLWLRGNLCLRVDLEATYERTCQEQRIPGNGG